MLAVLSPAKSLDFSDSGIAVEATEAGVELSVSDRGIGIDPRDRKRILKRFVRADHEAVRSRHGTGLGLTVAAAMVRRSGGRLDIASPGVGHGTTVTIRWPRASADPRAS